MAGPMWEPMAITIMFGLVFATALTLGFVPLMYSVLFRVSHKGIQLLAARSTAVACRRTRAAIDKTTSRFSSTLIWTAASSFGTTTTSPRSWPAEQRMARALSDQPTRTYPSSCKFTNDVMAHRST